MFTFAHLPQILTSALAILLPVVNFPNAPAGVPAASGDGGEGGPVSYAGRQNADQNVYPGIFKLQEDVTTTPIMADDYGSGDVENHENGQLAIFLFLDGHVDHIRRNAGFTNADFEYNPLQN